MGNRLPFFIDIKMKLRAILEGRWYTGRNVHQIWAEWAVWARWQILNGSQFFFHFNDKWLAVDNISWIYYQICLDKKVLLIHLRDCCGLSLIILTILLGLIKMHLLAKMIFILFHMTLWKMKNCQCCMKQQSNYLSSCK